MNEEWTTWILSWSPDGQSIDYKSRSDSNLYIYSIQDAKSRQIIRAENNIVNEPDFSPDGRQIAFIGNLSSKLLNIYALNLDGPETLQLTDFGEDSNRQPDWSPAGEDITYVKDHDIFFMKKDGSKARQMAHGLFNTAQAWSPDGKYIVFDNYIIGEQWATLWFLEVHSGALKQIASRGSFSPEWSQLRQAENQDCTSG
jgi:Tol biopolymer transport system component